MEYEELIQAESKRQCDNIELIASENFCSQRIKDAVGSCLTNKYAEGYPNKRYYGGCKWIDEIESKAIRDACTLFHTNYANVQPHCGSSANQAVYRAFLKPGDIVLGMDLGAGGHLTHGHKMSFSGQDYDIHSYGVTEDGILDYQSIEDNLYKYGADMIIVGASSYSREIDYERIARIIEDYVNMTGASKPIYMVDMAHVAGLIATGLHQSPVGWADVITSTTHKTLRGPRGGLILWNNPDYTDKINKAVFPGIQGGPLEHVIAGKGICFEEAMTDEYKQYMQQVVANAKILAQEMINRGWKIVSGGTDNHMFVLDVYNSIGLTGREAEIALDRINITVNKNQIPNDTLPPLKSSGIRIGTPAMTTRGFKEQEMKDLAFILDKYLRAVKEDSLDEETLEAFLQMEERLISPIRKEETKHEICRHIN